MVGALHTANNSERDAMPAWTSGRQNSRSIKLHMTPQEFCIIIGGHGARFANVGRNY